MIAVLGKHGFVGSTLCDHFTASGIAYEGISRSEFPSFIGRSDISLVINCAMPSGRFSAKSEPFNDFEETVLKTAKIKYCFPNAKLIQISSISASVQSDTIYGKHKRMAELLLDKDDLIIRLGPLYHTKLAKGALIDIMEDQMVYVSGESKYGFTPLDWVCEFIINNLNMTGLVELGASGFILLKDLAKQLNSKSDFSGPLDHQVFTDVFEGQPAASDVVNFCRDVAKVKQ
jgi:dTDP-4-dehydrorhamnose reductase